MGINPNDAACACSHSARMHDESGCYADTGRHYDLCKCMWKQ